MGNKKKSTSVDEIIVDNNVNEIVLDKPNPYKLMGKSMIESLTKEEFEDLLRRVEALEEAKKKDCECKKEPNVVKNTNYYVEKTYEKIKSNTCLFDKYNLENFTYLFHALVPITKRFFALEMLRVIADDLNGDKVFQSGIYVKFKDTHSGEKAIELMGNYLNCLK